MNRVAIAGQYLDHGVAIGNDALQMKEILAAEGHEVELFSCQWVKKTRCAHDVDELPAFLGEDPDAILIYHHAIGWTTGVELCGRLQCRRVVRYHNVTPAHFFAGYPGAGGPSCQEGREQLRPLIDADCELYLSDSLYNQQELIDLGADPRRCAVCPPFHAIDRLLEVEADSAVLQTLQNGWTNILFVGRCVPHKGHRYLIDAFAAYHQHYNERSRLILVGQCDPPLMAYGNQLRAQAERLGLLDKVIFIHRATEAELKAYYQGAHVFLLASEHEGFCVPIVEAMALKAPVIAYGTTAVPDTLGNTGLLWEDPDPMILAQSIHRIQEDKSLRRALVERAWRRYHSHFTSSVIAQVFEQAMKRL